MPLNLRRPGSSRARKLATLAVAFACVASTTACTLLESSEQAGHVENRSTIRGQIETRATRGPTYAVLYEQTRDGYELTGRYAISDSGRYVFHVLPGRYVLGAFSDSNDDGHYQASEPAAYVGDEKSGPKTLHVEPGKPHQISTLTVSDPIAVDGPEQAPIDIRGADPNLGRRVALDDPLFDRANARLGFWRPLDHIERRLGGLVRLEEFSPDKTPVLFVHGIEGTARDFRSVITALDRKRFQPWVFQYASGLPLDPVSDYLRQALTELQARYGFQEVIIIAHSMGGLITRDLVLDHAAAPARFRIPLVVTINSPLMGLDSAATGVEYSPLVIPAWRDLVPASEFVANLHQRDWPAATRYHLFFSFLPDEPGDGVVPLSSQLSLELQDEADRVLGFRAQHSALLHDPRLVERLHRLLMTR